MRGNSRVSPVCADLARIACSPCVCRPFPSVALPCAGLWRWGVFVTADGESNKQQWSETAKGLCTRGCAASGFEVQSSEGDVVA